MCLAQATDPRTAWAPIALLIVMAIVFAVGTLILSAWVGPRRNGPGKDVVYESGMIPTGDAHRRFNVRFYMVAMIFLIFDVEIVLFYPWATIFPTLRTPLLLVEMLLFVLILLVAYFYAWGKGVFKWE